MTIPVFRSTERDPLARGRALGASHREAVHATWAGYARLYAVSGARDGEVRSLAERALEEVHAWVPELAAEVAGIAAGAGLELWQVGALTARTEVLAALHAPDRSSAAELGADAPATGAERHAPLGECSTFVTLGAGEPPRTIQTWDWYDHLRGGVVALDLEPRAGHGVRVFTEFGVVGKIGVNTAGVGVHFNILGHERDGGPPGVPVHAIARRILDQATSLDDAIAIARSARVSASTVLTVVTWDGTRAAARCLELSPAGVAEIAPRDGVLLHTNHFLDAGLAANERMASDDPTTYRRLDELARRVPALQAAPDAQARALALLSHAADEAPPLCCHPAADAPLDQRWETLMTISLDLGASRLELHEGGPCAVGDDGGGGGGWVRV